MTTSSSACSSGSKCPREQTTKKPEARDRKPGLPAAAHRRAIRRVEIRTRRLVNTLFSGDYKSSFKGRGIEFLDLREYLPGDDIRTIDWNTSARYGMARAGGYHPFVKKFAEERELVVMLVVDASGSTRFGTAGRGPAEARRDSAGLLKLEQSALLAATLAFSAIRNNDKVGLVFFSDRVERYVPPRKGRSHVLRLIRDILYFEPEGRGTEPGVALEFLMNVVKRRAIVFLVSDFLGPGFAPAAFRIPLGIAARRHDLVAVSVTDPAEEELPGLGLVDLEDAETGEMVTVAAGDPAVRRALARTRADEREAREALFRRLGVDHIPIRTDEDFTGRLHRFFQQRAKRR